jgi:rubredoxin
MLSNTVGENPGLQLQLQQQLLLRFQAQEKKRTQRVQGVWWLDQPKAARSGAPPEVRSWTCPRCRSHRCIKTNPGNTRQATYCCAICGYVFTAAASTRLLQDTGL